MGDNLHAASFMIATVIVIYLSCAFIVQN